MKRIPLIPGLFVIGIVVAGGAMLGKRLARAVRKKSWAGAPGRSEGHPYRVTEMDELDQVIRSTRCYCGGRLEPLSEEGGRGEPGVRVARVRCTQCETEHPLYFDLREVRH